MVCSDLFEKSLQEKCQLEKVNQICSNTCGSCCQDSAGDILIDWVRVNCDIVKANCALYCEYSIASNFCPHACLDCMPRLKEKSSSSRLILNHSRTSASLLFEPQVSLITCVDDPNYTFSHKDMMHNCDWLKKTIDSCIRNMCNEEVSTSVDGRRIKEGCTKTCTDCKDLSTSISSMILPTYPSRPNQSKISRASSQSIIESQAKPISCVDNPEFYIKKQKETCKWIRQKTNRRKKFCKQTKVFRACAVTCGKCCADDPNYIFVYKNKMKSCNWLKVIQHDNVLKNVCKKVVSDGKRVKFGCRKSCNNCYTRHTQKPTPLPTLAIQSQVPSPLSSIASSQVPSLLPNWAPSWIPSQVPSMFLSCTDNPNFYTYDEKTCIWIGKVQTRQNIYCNNLNIIRACPNACGNCCADDINYTFLYETMDRNCEWLTWRKDDVREKLCDEKVSTSTDGRLINEGCSQTCNNCNSPSKKCIDHK